MQLGTICTSVVYQSGSLTKALPPWPRRELVAVVMDYFNHLYREFCSLMYTSQESGSFDILKIAGVVHCVDEMQKELESKAPLWLMEALVPAICDRLYAGDYYTNEAGQKVTLPAYCMKADVSGGGGCCH